MHSEDNKRSIEVLGRNMAYVEAGRGEPIVLLHGNPTSSYLWRNIIPEVEGHGRCIAPDLIGMGDSDKLPGPDPDRYRFVEQRRFLDAFLNAVGVTERVVIVCHDWGGVLGFDWANRHRSAIRAIAYMETFVQPATWEEYPQEVARIFQALRSPEGERMCLEENFFVEQMLPLGVIRDLTEHEMNAYRRPFCEPGEGRRPTLALAREVPIDGEPEDLHEIVASYAAWMASNDLPKLFVQGEPGQIMARRRQREFCRHWRNQVEVTIPGRHFVQEDAPREIGTALVNWLRKL